MVRSGGGLLGPDSARAASYLFQARRDSGEGLSAARAEIPRKPMSPTESGSARAAERASACPALFRLRLRTENLRGTDDTNVIDFPQSAAQAIGTGLLLLLDSPTRMRPSTDFQDGRREQTRESKNDQDEWLPEPRVRGPPLIVVGIAVVDGCRVHDLASTLVHYHLLGLGGRLSGPAENGVAPALRGKLLVATVRHDDEACGQRHEEGGHQPMSHTRGGGGGVR